MFLDGGLLSSTCKPSVHAGYCFFDILTLRFKFYSLFRLWFFLLFPFPISILLSPAFQFLFPFPLGSIDQPREFYKYFSSCFSTTKKREHVLQSGGEEG